MQPCSIWTIKIWQNSVGSLTSWECFWHLQKHSVETHVGIWTAADNAAGEIQFPTYYALQKIPQFIYFKCFKYKLTIASFIKHTDMKAISLIPVKS